VAALYLELGLEAASRIVMALWAPLIEEPVDLAAADPKSALQEWAAAEARPAPIYQLLSRTGPDHQPEFTVQVSIAEDTPATGVGGSLQAAQKAAALTLLKRRKADP
jgi:ribonuclease-3